MACTGIKAEMAEEGLLGPLIITEEGDITEGVTGRGATGSLAAIARGTIEGMALKEEEKHTGEDKEESAVVNKVCLEEWTSGNQTGEAAADGKDKLEDGTPGETENMYNGQNRGEGERINGRSEKPSYTGGEKVTHNDPRLDTKGSKLSEQQPKGTPSEEEDRKKAHRLTPDFPEALYELLCTLQEGRRLNDQRCSFRLESGMGRRRCHSEPNATKPVHRVMFSSMTSLQKEEFFELVATAQARRLDDQRAKLERSPPPKPKGRSFRGSIKQLSFVKKPAPVPEPPKDDLYNMILTTQAQGRLEDQRSRAPGIMDDEDFFSLLLRVQGGRMEEQRTELPCMLQT